MSLPTIETPTYVAQLTDSFVKFRPYTVKEEKQLLMAAESNDPKIIFETTIALCQTCVLDDIDITDLPLFDLERLLIATRSKSVGEEVKTSMRCPHCEQLTDFVMNVENIKSEKPDGIQNTIMLNEKYGVKLRYPSIKTTGLNLISEKEDIVDILLSCIESVFDENTVYPLKDSTEEEQKAFIESLSVEHIRAITEGFLEKIPTNVINIDFKCPKCQNQIERRLDNLLDFFT